MGYGVCQGRFLCQVDGFVPTFVVLTGADTESLDGSLLMRIESPEELGRRVGRREGRREDEVGKVSGEPRGRGEW